MGQLATGCAENGPTVPFPSAQHGPLQGLLTGGAAPFDISRVTGPIYFLSFLTKRPMHF